MQAIKINININYNIWRRSRMVFNQVFYPGQNGKWSVFMEGEKPENSEKSFLKAEQNI